MAPLPSAAAQRRPGCRSVCIEADKRTIPIPIRALPPTRADQAGPSARPAASSRVARVDQQQETEREADENPVEAQDQARGAVVVVEGVGHGRGVQFRYGPGVREAGVRSIADANAAVSWGPSFRSPSRGCVRLPQKRAASRGLGRARRRLRRGQVSQRIWIVRHGNREDFQNPGWATTAQRPYDPALSADGEIQAQEVGHSLREAPIDCVFASPFLRTIQTASPIAEALGLPIFVEPGIAEILPNIERAPDLMPEEERARRFPRVETGYRALGRLPYPESAEAGHERAAAAVKALAARYAERNLLAVTHGAPVVGIVRGLTGLQERISAPLCCIFSLQRAGGGWRLTQRSEISHLSDQQTSRRYAHVG